MEYKTKVARAAIAAGLGALLTFGSSGIAFAEGQSTGETKLYIVGNQDDLTTSEGSATANVKVTIPVAIHYVADSEGNLVGPSNDTVKFVNHTSLGAVHVSKIAVQNAGQAKIVSKEDLGDDEIRLYVKPVAGTSDANGQSFTAQTGAGQAASTKDELGAYANKTQATAISPTYKNDWNIARDNGALALNELTGKIGGYDKLDPATEYQAGTVHWTVRPGTRAEADLRDATVTIRFNCNNGSNAGGVPIADQTVKVLDDTQLPTVVVLSGALEETLDVGASDVVPPKARTNADGTVTSYVFDSWNTQADGNGTTVSTVGDLGQASAIAGTVQELYAIYVPVNS